MYIYIYVYIHTNIHVYIYIYIHIHTYIHIYNIMWWDHCKRYKKVRGSAKDKKLKEN